MSTTPDQNVMRPSQPQNQPGTEPLYPPVTPPTAPSQVYYTLDGSEYTGYTQNSPANTSNMPAAAQNGTFYMEGSSSTPNISNMPTMPPLNDIPTTASPNGTPSPLYPDLSYLPRTGNLPANNPNTPNTPFATGPLTDTRITTTRITTKSLTVKNANTTTKIPLVIPATEKRSSISHKPPKPSRRRRVVLAAWISSVAILILTLVLVSPLGLGEQQTLTLFDNLFAPSSQSSFNPGDHVLPPTPTPALLTNDGYCGGHDIWGTCATAVTASGLMGTGHMQRPITGSHVTQYFANPEYQIWCGCIKPHSGIDLAAPLGTPITAADSGQVLWVGWDWSGLGWAVKINHGHYIATIYGHMASYTVKAGQNVMKGQTIGYEGSTGASSGPHVHFMVLVNNIWVDPTMYVALP